MSQPELAAPPSLPVPPPAIIPSSSADGNDTPALFDHLALGTLLRSKMVDLDDISWDYGLSLDALMDILDGRSQPPERLRDLWEREIASVLPAGDA